MRKIISEKAVITIIIFVNSIQSLHVVQFSNFSPKYFREQKGGHYPEGGSLGDGNDPQWPPANKKSICLNLPSFCFPVYGKFRPILM